MSLRSLQEVFQSYLCDETPAIMQEVVADEKVAIATRLEIYKDAYEGRLTDCLRANYPNLCAYLGDEQFRLLTKSYIKNFPSPFYSIRWYGDFLAKFVADFYPQDLHLAELTEFEWNITLAFDAADDSRLSIHDMAAVPPEQWGALRFKVHPSVQIMNCHWNTAQLWQSLTDDLDLPAFLYQQQPTSWLIWRTEEYFIKFISLASVEAILWAQLVDGKDFSQLCEQLCICHPIEEVGMHAASYLKGWIERGLLAAIIYPS